MDSVSQKSSPRKLFALLWRICVTENFIGYFPNIFLHFHQFWSICLNSYMNCITFNGKSPQILTFQFSLLQNS